MHTYYLHVNDKQTGLDPRVHASRTAAALPEPRSLASRRVRMCSSSDSRPLLGKVAARTLEPYLELPKTLNEGMVLESYRVLFLVLGRFLDGGLLEAPGTCTRQWTCTEKLMIRILGGP